MLEDRDEKQAHYSDTADYYNKDRKRCKKKVRNQKKMRFFKKSNKFFQSILDNQQKSR